MTRNFSGDIMIVRTIGRTLSALIVAMQVTTASAQESFDGLKLGAWAHELTPRVEQESAREESRGAYIIRQDYFTTDGHVGDIIRWAGGRLQGCTLEHAWTGQVYSDGTFDYGLTALYPSGVRTQVKTFRTKFGAPADQEARTVLAGASETYFKECRREQGYPSSALAGEGQRHVDQLIPALNERLDNCTLRAAGKVGEPDSDGNFRFYMEAVYPGNTVDAKIHFETNHKNVMTTELADFLGLIPSQAFKQCRHKPVGPDPRIDQMKRHVQAIVAAAGDKLENCSLVADGDPGTIDNQGSADYYVNARYPDGSSDTRRSFRTNLSTPVATAAQQIIDLVPGQIFGRCRIRGSGPDPRVEQMKQHVAAIATAVSAKLEQCTIVADGDPGAIDGNGAADYYLNARYTDGTTDSRKAFRTSLSTSVSSAANDVLAMIPTQIFRRCRERGGDTPDPRIEQLKRHVAAVLQEANTKLDQCVLVSEGDPGVIGGDGFADFHVNARYVDGSTDTRKRFRTSLSVGVGVQAAELLELIPTSIFRRCKIRGGDNPPPPPPDDDLRVRAQAHVAQVLSLFNDRLDNCILALNGRISPVDEHGNFFYYLMAYVRADGTFTETARFQSNLNTPVDAEVTVMGRLIPAVEFKKCRQRS